jgi:hypothetical protein
MYTYILTLWVPAVVFIQFGPSQEKIDRVAVKFLCFIQWQILNNA